MEKFPENFLFGAAISSHQTEGGCHNNWSEWELKNCIELAASSSSMSHIYSGRSFKEEAFDKENYISGQGIDHYNKFAEDFSMAKEIGLNALRFSIEWSRIEPEEGKWDNNELKHYCKVIEELKKNHIEPFVTIWHWTLPLWLSAKGGVTARDFPFYFERLSARITETFKGMVKFYITINEPEIFSLNSYLLGKWPPQKKGIISYLNSMNKLKKAHLASYDAIKNIDRTASVGAALNMTSFEAHSFVGYIFKYFAKKFWNDFFIEKVKDRMDFIGLNYYFHRSFLFKDKSPKNYSDMGWELYPAGISIVLEELKSYGKPIYITENGLADCEDKYRGWYIKEVLKNVLNSIESGVDVRGYFHWSLMDNFEWDKGFWPKFGLIDVDRKTMKRNIRSSAFIYRDIIERGFR